MGALSAWEIDSDFIFGFGGLAESVGWRLSKGAGNGYGVGVEVHVRLRMRCFINNLGKAVKFSQVLLNAGHSRALIKDKD